MKIKQRKFGPIPINRDYLQMFRLPNWYHKLWLWLLPTYLDRDHGTLYKLTKNYYWDMGKDLDYRKSKGIKDKDYYECEYTEKS